MKESGSEVTAYTAVLLTRPGRRLSGEEDLLCKSEDLNPQTNPLKSQDMATHACNPSAARGRELPA